jgi:hypothetical protein
VQDNSSLRRPMTSCSDHANVGRIGTLHSLYRAFQRHAQQ